MPVPRRSTKHSNAQLTPTKSPNAADRIAYRIPEAAALTGTSKGTVYNAINSGQLAYFRLPGGVIRVSRIALEAWVSGK